MRTRHSTGGVRKQRGRWLGLWYEGGRKKSKVLGLVSKMTKGEAREKIARFVAAERARRDTDRVWILREFVEEVYFPYYSRKWKRSTRDNNVNRIRVHLMVFEHRELARFRRDELQDLLDQKAGSLSYSVVDHLRWDLKQIFDMAVAEGLVPRNPATLLFTPKDAIKRERRVMKMKEAQLCFSVLDDRERLIAKLAVLAGMRPGEIFALRWGHLTATYADIRQRVYKGVLDTPKTDHSLRKAALSKGLLAEIERWRTVSIETSPEAWVFPSENMTPLSKDNCWRRWMQPRLKTVGLGWANFLVMRRTHATLMNALGVNGKLVADQLGHSLDVSQNVYTQSPVESRLDAVNQLEESLLVM
jgi:integrase